MDSTEIEQPIVQTMEEKIHGNDISEIKNSQDADEETFEITDGEIVDTVDESVTKNEFKKNHKTILFDKYYRIVERNKSNVTAECNSCKLIVKDSVLTCSSTRRHLKFRHVELYENYQEEVQCSGDDFEDLVHLPIDGDEPIDIEPINENNTVIEFKQNYKRILFKNYFIMSSKNENDMRATCKMCNSRVKCDMKFRNLYIHLKRKHPEEHAKYNKQVKESRYEPEDISDENEIEFEFEEVSKRILFKDYFKLISKSEDKGMTAVCRSCKYITNSKNNLKDNFRAHLKKHHPDLYKKYKKKLGTYNRKTSKYHQLNMDDGKEIIVNLTDIKSHRKKTLNATKETSLDEPQSKHRRMSQPSNDDIEIESIDHSTELGQINAEANLPANEFEDEPIVGEIDMDELFYGFEPEQNNDRPEMEVEIVREDADPAEFVKEEPQLSDEYGNGMYENDISTIEAMIARALDATAQPTVEITRNRIYGENCSRIKLNEKSQNIDGGTFGIKDGELVFHRLNTNNQKEFQFKTYALRTLFERHFRIIEKNEDNVRVVCNHCQLVLKGKLFHNNFRRHFKSQHAEIYEMYLADIMSHKKKEADAIKKRGASVIRIQFKTYATRTLYDEHFQIIGMKDGKVQVICNHCHLVLKGELYKNYFRGHLKNKHAEMYDKYLIDIICHKNKELNAESKEENTRSLFQNYFQVMSQREHQIMAECKICKSTLESNIKCESLFEHMKTKHQENYTQFDEETKQCRYNPEDICKENEIKVDFEENFKRILFEDYFKIITKTEDGVTAVCRTRFCEKELTDITKSLQILQGHLEYRHVEVYKKYQAEVQKSGLADIIPIDRDEPLHIEPIDENNTEIEFKQIYKRVLFKNYFNMLPKGENGPKVTCKMCNSVLKCDVDCINLSTHLKKMHPENYAKYQQEVKQHKYESEDVGDENEIKFEFKQKNKRILFKNFFKLIAKSEDKGMTAVCRSCKYIKHSKNSLADPFRKHLRKHHPDLYKKYKKQFQNDQYHPLIVNVEHDLKVKVKVQTYAKQKLYGEHFQISEKYNEKVWVVCKHCKKVLKGKLYENNFQRHLKRKHAEIYEKFLADIKCHKNKTSNASKEASVSTGKDQRQPVDPVPTVGSFSFKEPQTKHRRNSEYPNDDGSSFLPIESRHSDTAVDLPADDIEDEPIVHEIDVDELFYGFEQEQSSDRQYIEVEIVREAPEPDEFVKEEPQFSDEHGNEIYGNNISSIELNEHEARGTFEMEDGEIVHVHTLVESASAHMPEEGATEIECQKDLQNILSSDYYRIIEKNGNKVTAECNSCKLVVKDSILTCSSTRRHLKYCHAELYKEYQADVQNNGLADIIPIDEDEQLQIEPIDENNTEIEFKQIYKRILFKNYFIMSSKNENKIKATCKMCNSLLKCDVDCSILIGHLRNKHPEDHAKHREEVNNSKYEPKDIGDENEIKVEFKKQNKRILFKDYFKIIAKSEDGMTAVCRSCKYIYHTLESSTNPLRRHLWRHHPDLSKKYKEAIGYGQYYPINVNVEHEINVNARTYATQTLYEKHFQIIEKNKDKSLRVVCKHCKVIMKGTRSHNSFREHLKRKHADIHEMYMADILRHKKNEMDAIKKRQDKVIKMQFRTYAMRTLYDEHIRIIEKKEDNVLWVVCNHCELVLKGRLYKNSFRGHLKRKHAEIYEKFLADIKCHEIKEATMSIGKDAVPPVDSSCSLEAANSRHRKMSQPSNDDEIPTHSNELEPRIEHIDRSTESGHINAEANLTADEIGDEPIVDEIDVDTFFYGFEPEQNGDRQEMQVEIVREDPDPDELVKEEPQLSDEYGNGIYENDISTIEAMIARALDATAQPTVEIARNRIYGENCSRIKLNEKSQNIDGGTFGIKDGELVFNRLNTNEEKKIKVKFQTYAMQTLFEKHFRIIEKNEDKARVACNYCQINMRGSLVNYNFARHLTWKHAEIYEEYLADIKRNKDDKVNSCKNRDTKVSTANGINKKSVSVGRKRGRPVENIKKPHLKRRRNSKTLKYGGMMTTSIKPEHTDATLNLNTFIDLPSELPADGIKDEPIVTEIKMSELFGEIDQEQNCDWQEVEVEIIREDADPDELVKEEPQYYDGSLVLHV